jgi:hypothetical protein
MRPRKNPSVAGLPCAFCGRPAQSFGHFDAKGMGGDPKRLRTDGAPVCGVDHSDPTTCHGAIAIGELDAWTVEDGTVLFVALGKTAERLGVPEREIDIAWFAGKTFDEIGAGA